MMEQGAPSRARRRVPPSGKGSGVLARLVVWALVLVFPLTLLLGATGTAHADDAEDTLDRLSFYRLSSSMTALFSTAQEPSSDIDLEDTDWDRLLENPASAGSMLGYADSDYNPIMGWLNSRTAQSSDSVGYDTLMGNEDAGLEGVNGAREYALFGATLNGLGLDSTSTGLSLGFFNAIAGGIIFILFAATAAIDVLWSVLIDALSWLNPFKLFYWAVYALNPEFANGMTGGERPEGVFSSLAGWIGSWYLVLVELSWTVMVPLFIGTFLFSIVMFKKFDKGSGLKKLFIRLLFLGLGLPLLGSMYTGMLNAMDAATEEGNSGSTRVVLSTFVDFEGWAMQQRLRVPDSDEHDVYIEWDNRRNAPSGRSQASVRELALLINAQVMGLEGRIDPVSTDAGTSWGETALEPAAESVFAESDYSEVSDILFRYMGNAHVSASSFETQSKATLDCDEDSCDARAWFDDYIGDPEEVADLEDNVPIDQNPLIWVDEGTGLGVTRQLQDEGVESLFDYILYRYSIFHTRGDVSDCGLSLATAEGSPEACNLSPLAMYNYLNTDFGPTSYTAYSSGKSTSEATRSIHNSVSMVGTGTMSFVYWTNAVVLLGAFITIGFGYAIAMVIGNIRRTFQLMTAIPFATLGAISGIAKVIIYSIAMIMEVVVTLFLYKFVQEFLLSIPSIIEIPFSQVLNSRGEGDEAGMIAFLVSGGFVAMIVTLVSIIAVILFTVMAMRLRKTLVKAVEEASTKLVEKLTDSQVAPPGGGGGMLPAMAGGAAGGAGSALANRMMGGGVPQGGKGPNAGGTNGGGPEGISTSAANSNDTRVDGDVDTDGVLEGPESGDDGDDRQPGPGLDPGGQGGDAAREAELGRQVESEGLSLPPGSDAPGPSDPDNPRVGDGGEPMDVAAASAQQSADDYKQSDQARVGAVRDGAEAGVHAGIAFGRGAAGDAKGAAESGGKAAEKGGSAMAKNAQASQHRENAGKSSLDNQAPNPKHQQRIQQGQQISQAGRTVSDTAGMASGGTGGKPGGGGPKPNGSAPPTGKGGGNSGKPRGGRNRRT
ncbi:hypothetical protein MRI28_17660 [Nocardiopsis dassonvillei]|uniref:hypothetical protein n=1 Tax=Nocardiopsis dassonvillei TaxID=2014 RepID=UPI002010B728|nr:hypothetical protein [Nocardiopsis dassonvillei]MCK9871442.1 hypothetical protein [Nocardiopsis dassonvillei]